MIQKAAFLDRDGVLNYDYGYVGDWKRFKLIPGVITACRILQEKNYHLIIITNQSGISRGFFTHDQYLLLQNQIMEHFAHRNIFIKETFYCPHHPKGTVDAFVKACRCRKPMPGLIQEASSRFNIDLHNSLMFGDKKSDQEAAKNAGVGNFVPVGSEFGIYSNLLDAVKGIFNGEEPI